MTAWVLIVHLLFTDNTTYNIVIPANDKAACEKMLDMAKTQIKQKQNDNNTYVLPGTNKKVTVKSVNAECKEKT